MGRHDARRPTVASGFDDLVAPHRAALQSYVCRITGGDQAATEIVLKETLYRAAQDPTRYPRTEAAVRPWLLLIARGPPPAGRPGPSAAQALAELPDDQRNLLIELFYGGGSIEDAAAARRVGVTTVKIHLGHALRALHRRLT